MDNLILTRLTIDEFREIFRDEISRLTHSNPNKHSDEGDLLNINQASTLLNLSKATVYTLVCRRKIPFYKKSKRLYFSRLDLIDWIKMGRTKTAEELSVEANTTLNRAFKKRTSGSK